MLEAICKNEPGTIRAAVAEEALDRGDPSMIFEDLPNCGCTCGLVGSLIHYVDTQNFYDDHYAEIEKLRKEWEANTGKPFKIKGDLKGFFAWFAFKETVYRMAIDDLGLEG